MLKLGVIMWTTFLRNLPPFIYKNFKPSYLAKLSKINIGCSSVKIISDTYLVIHIVTYQELHSPLDSSEIPREKITFSSLLSARDVHAEFTAYKFNKCTRMNSGIRRVH